MHRSTCLLRIGTRQVHGVCQAASWTRGARIEAAAEFSSIEPHESAPSLRGAIDAVLEIILPHWTLTSPFIRVSLAGSHVMAAVLRFVKLPASAADRGLVVTQRFCREHRLDPGSIAIIECSRANSKKVNANILCLAADRSLLGEIQRALTGRGLYPDVIAPEYLLSFAEAEGLELEMPAIAVFEESGCNTILVWDKEGAIIHVATVRRDGGNDLEVQRRLDARIKRYAQIVAEQGAPPAIYFDSQIAANLVRPVHGLRLLRWPAQTPEQRRAGPYK
jgi:hypothetical protein